MEKKMVRTKMVTRFLAIGAFFCTAAAGAFAQGKAEHWKAQWITAPGVAERDLAVVHFRKALDLANLPKEFMVDVSADNQFILYVNGKEAGRGPSRAELPHWRYETLDIATKLHPGKNVLAALVWHLGTRAAVAQMSERTGFLLHGANETSRVADTNESWEAEIETGIEVMPPKMKDYFAAEPGLRIEGGKFDWDAKDGGNGKGAWRNAVTLGRGALREERDAPNNWQLVADMLPPMEMTEDSVGEEVDSKGQEHPFPQNLTLLPGKKVSVLFDHRKLTTGYPMLAVSGGNGAKIRLTYSEALYDAKGEKGNRNEIAGKHIEGVIDEFLPGGGTAIREFSPMTWRTWRYVKMEVETADEPLTISAVKAFFSAYPFEEKAVFHSNDASLEPIWAIGWRTARLDAHDTYMDTPYWERLQYIGDTRIQALISYSVAGDDRLARQAIEAFNDSRTTDGLTQSRYPSSLRQMIPTFSLLWVGMVHDFWMYRGNEEFVRKQVPGTRTVLEWFLRRQRADGLLGKIPWWPFVDWGADFDAGESPQDVDGGSSVMTLQFVEALRYASELELKFGDAGIAKIYANAAARAEYGVWKLCWNEKHGLLADTPAQKHFSQHANILGVWLDVIPYRYWKDVLGKVLSTSDAGFAASGDVPSMTLATYYFRFYLARAIEHAGMGGDYLKLLGPWRQMVGLGLTTWAESPEPTRSDSHAWSAHPNFDLLRIVAGIRPASPGFQTITIEPNLGSLNEIKAKMPVPQGIVEVEYERTANGVRTRVKLPTGVKGMLLWNGKENVLREGEQTLNLP